jgi:hypothetical protein
MNPYLIVLIKLRRAIKTHGRYFLLLPSRMCGGQFPVSHLERNGQQQVSHQQQL